MNERQVTIGCVQIPLSDIQDIEYRRDPLLSEWGPHGYDPSRIHATPGPTYAVVRLKDGGELSGFITEAAVGEIGEEHMKPAHLLINGETVAIADIVSFEDPPVGSVTLRDGRTIYINDYVWVAPPPKPETRILSGIEDMAAPIAAEQLALKPEVEKVLRDEKPETWRDRPSLL